jgi:hypothetical protein
MSTLNTAVYMHVTLSILPLASTPISALCGREMRAGERDLRVKSVRPLIECDVRLSEYYPASSNPFTLYIIHSGEIEANEVFAVMS